MHQRRPKNLDARRWRPANWTADGRTRTVPVVSSRVSRWAATAGAEVVAAVRFSVATIIVDFFRVMDLL